MNIGYEDNDLRPYQDAIKETESKRIGNVSGFGLRSFNTCLLMLLYEPGHSPLATCATSII